MAVKFVLDEPRLGFWILFHQAHNVLFKCEENVSVKTGLSPQQAAVLMAIKYIEGPVTISEVAKWVDRNPNSVTMIVDRMVRDGLVRRLRDRRDRRTVRLAMTREGEEKFGRATGPGWRMIQGLLSSFSKDELKTFAYLTEKLRTRAFEELASGESMEEVKRHDVRAATRRLKRVHADA